MFNKENDKEEKKEVCEEKMVSIKESEYKALLEDRQKAAEYWDRILRLQADFENARKRLEKDKQDFMRFANEGIIMELLNILDDLERTLELAQEKHQDLATFVKGVEMILAHLYELLKAHGVKPIEAQGKIFDPNFHEAISEQESAEVAEGKVLMQLRKGYKFKDRLLRPATVIVAKKPAIAA